MGSFNAIKINHPLFLFITRVCPLVNNGYLVGDGRPVSMSFLNAVWPPRITISHCPNPFWQLSLKARSWVIDCAKMMRQFFNLQRTFASALQNPLANNMYDCMDLVE